MRQIKLPINQSFNQLLIPLPVDNPDYLFVIFPPISLPDLTSSLLRFPSLCGANSPSESRCARANDINNKYCFPSSERRKASHVLSPLLFFLQASFSASGTSLHKFKLYLTFAIHSVSKSDKFWTKGILSENKKDL